MIETTFHRILEIDRDADTRRRAEDEAKSLRRAAPTFLRNVVVVRDT